MRHCYPLMLILIGLAACSALTPSPGKSGLYRVGFTTEPDLADVPSLMAHGLLRREGYTVETTFFAGADLEVAAMAQGDLDLGNGSTRTHWNAVAKGVPIVTVMEEAADAWSLVAKNEIALCADLHGRRVAYTSPGALNAALLNAYLQRDCPRAEPQILLIANSATRSAALLTGELDATPLELVDVMQVEREGGGKFHTLVNFSIAFPKLKTTGVHVRSDFARQHSTQMHDYLKALLTVHRQIRKDPASLVAAAEAHLKMERTDAQSAVDAYLRNNIWDANGGMTRDAISFSVDFFAETGAVPEGLTAEQVADLSYLEAVLNELGRE
jgi:ABC-type nitrate/sulfonate/bicarbonate transport system substrate-binding protein